MLRLIRVGTVGSEYLHVILKGIWRTGAVAVLKWVRGAHLPHELASLAHGQDVQESGLACKRAINGSKKGLSSRALNELVHKSDS